MTQRVIVHPTTRVLFEKDEDYRHWLIQSLRTQSDSRWIPADAAEVMKQAAEYLERRG